MNLFDFIVRRRFYIRTGDVCSIVYECMDEEGAGVKKKVTQGTKQHCKRFLAEAQKQWMAWLEANFMLSRISPSPSPPTATEIMAKLPKPKKKEKVVVTPQITISSGDPEQR